MSVTPCPPNTPIARGVVVFDPTAFKAAYPSFVTLADTVLQQAFALATLQLNNSCSSRVKDATTRELLLGLLVAHIAALTYGENGQPPRGIVGHVNHAQEGSVSVGAGVGVMATGQAYYMQTQYGAMYWQATARYRTMRYIPAPPVCADFGALGRSDELPWGGPEDCGC